MVCPASESLQGLFLCREHPPTYRCTTLDLALGQWYPSKCVLQGRFGNLWRQVWLSQLGRMMLLSSGEKPGCCWPSYKTQDGPYIKELPNPVCPQCPGSRALLQSMDGTPTFSAILIPFQRKWNLIHHKMGLRIKPHQLPSMWCEWLEEILCESGLCGWELDSLDTGRGTGWGEGVKIIHNWNPRGNFTFPGGWC